MKAFANRRCAPGLVLLAWFLTSVVGLPPSSIVQARPDEPYRFSELEAQNPNGERGFFAPIAINDRHEMVGGFAGMPGVFIVRKGQGVSKIECPHAGVTIARGLNNSGAVAGSCDRQAFFRDRRGSLTLIDAPGASNTQGRALNDRDDVVGYFRDSSPAHVQHGFLWNSGRASTFDLPGLQNVIPYPHGINNPGQIVGDFSESACNCNERGFLLSRGTLTTIDFPGATATLPYAINDRGEIVGWYVDRTEHHHGFILDDGVFATVDVPGTDFTEIYGINNAGEIVGRSYSRSGREFYFLGTPQ